MHTSSSLPPARSLPSAPSSVPPAAAQHGAHLRFDGVSLSFAGRRVLTDVSFAVSAGERTGLIGENGSGKTTLLRLAAGLLTPDAGQVRATAPGPEAPRLGLLHQEVPFPPTASVTEALESAVAPVRAAAAAVDSAAAHLAESPESSAAARAYQDALEAAERLDAWAVEARIETMLAGLGLADLPREAPTARLSGGQRSRLSLAWVLLSAPDVLLLDEPTNHLDETATEHLRSVLAGWPGPVLLASHDRAFLDEAVTTLVDLDPSPLPHAAAGPLVGDGDGTGIGAVRFTGRYTDYLQARFDARDRWERQYRREQAELKRLRREVRENQTHGHTNRDAEIEVRAAKKVVADRNAKTVARRVHDVRGRLEELAEVQIRKPPADLWFRGLDAARSGASSGSGGSGRRTWSGPVLAAVGAAVTGRLAPTVLTVSAGERWLLTGPNGSGKSTLLRVLAGDLVPTAGTVGAPAALRVGLLAQETELEDPQARGADRSARQAYVDLVGERRAEDVPLSAFGLLPGRDENRPVDLLSVGQRRRLALAVLLADPPDVLLLDEPTNHLSLLLATQLERALPGYPGTVLVASHDRWLRRSWEGRRVDLGVS